MYLNIYKHFWQSLDSSQKSKYYTGLLFLNEDRDYITTDSVLHQYLTDIQNPEIIQWLSVAKAYYHLGDYDKASDAIDNYIQYDGEEDGSFFFINALVYEAKGDFQLALDYYKSYIAFNGENDAYLFGSDARFVEERINAETRLVKKNYTIVIVILALFSVILLVIIIEKSFHHNCYLIYSFFFHLRTKSGWSQNTGTDGYRGGYTV